MVLVVVDTLRADHLDLYGYDRPTAPFLRSLSKEAVHFVNARAQAGCTFPSVNSLLTSRHATVFLDTMRETGWGIPPTIPTLAEMLRSTGYSTLGVSASPIVRAGPGPQNPNGGFGAGFDVFDEECERKPASCVNERALAAVRDATQPFFLLLHYFDPHDPYQPPPSFERSFANGYSGKAWVQDGSLIPVFRALYGDGPDVEFDDSDLAHVIDLYDDEIQYVDGELERLVLGLRSMEVWDRTLLIVASDHGEEFMEHGDLFHCKSLGFDTVLRTPLVIRTPGGSHHGARSALAENLDILPTVLDYAAIESDGLRFEGRSLRSTIRTDEPIRRLQFAAQTYARAVTDGRWKLVLDISSGKVELFDLARDPLEQIEISRRRPARRSELLRALNRWIEHFEAQDESREHSLERERAAFERLRALGYV